ncbi:MAG: hypothetical protein IJW98_02745 [Clostridia bacterium]|nr:hypothetical protein [Clostridia bacterium]
MKLKLKRIIAVLLVAVLCFAAIPFSAFAASTQFAYTDEDIEDLYYDYEYLAGMLEGIFYSDKGIAYWKYANEMEDKKVASWLIDKANTILGESPDEKYYTKILTNMIAMFEYDMADQVEQQGQYDNMKNVAEYGLDLLDIGATVVGLEDTGEKIGKVLSLASDGIDLVLDTANKIKYYELTIQNYAKAEKFLAAVNEYSENKALSEAAHELRTVNELLLKERVKCISDMGGNVGMFSAKNFLSDFSFSILKKVDAYQSDPLVKDYVDYGEQAYKAIDRLISTGKAVFKTVMLGGDLLFGTTNTFRRHNEMMTMADIAEALIAANNAVKVDKNASAEAIYSNIHTKCEYYKMLLSVHLRGEHLIYSLNSNDAGVLSQISKWVDEYCKDEDKTIKKWYDGQAKSCEEYYNKVKDLFVRLMQQKYVVHNGFELHDGFICEIERKKTVPEGYIGVYSFADFKQIADSCPSDAHITSIYTQATEANTAKYILMNDITLPADYDMTGTFYGVLDGNGYTMSGLNKPLFRYIGNATVKNLGLEISCTIDAEDNELNFGAIARCPNSFHNKNNVYIDNCFVKGNVTLSCRSGSFGGLLGIGDGAYLTNCYNEADIDVKTRQTAALGGICGEDGAITNCFNTGSLSLYTTCENTFNPETVEAVVGGIKGYNFADSIRNCYNTGSISAETAIGCRVRTGGIIGYNYGSASNAYVENCYNLGRVTNEWADAYDPSEEYGGAFKPSYSSGGIVGYTGYNLYINKCWNGGTISGEHFVGGIIGGSGGSEPDSITNCYNIGAISAVQYAGGIVGKDFHTTGIVCSYNAGVISGALHCGSIVGFIQNDEENLVSCYYVEGGAGATASGISYPGAKAITTAQLAVAATFEGFDFIDTWKLRDDDSMPQLKQ